MSEQNPKPHFSLLRIYTKNSSFEAPQTPSIFLKDFTPSVDIEVNLNNSKIQDNVYEVLVRVTATMQDKTDENDVKTVYIVEVEQAGLFEIVNLEEEHLYHALETAAPAIIFPYLREAIDSLVVKSTFSPLMLAPVNFEALYLQKLEQQKK